MKSACFEYVRAGSASDATLLLQKSAGMGKVIGGGQSLGPMMNLRLAQPELLVDVRTIAALHTCVIEPDAVVLGAATTHAAIEDGLVRDPAQGMMAYVASGIAYRAVRNRGTLGGSLAHADPAADWINLMAILDAEYLLQGPSSQRTVTSENWMLGAFTTALAEDEVLTAVRIPALLPGTRWSYYKVNRKAGEFADAIAAFIDDPERGVRRALIGATDGAPHVITDASPLINGWDDAFADGELQAAGLVPDTYEYQIHAVALRRAALRLTTKDGKAP